MKRLLIFGFACMIAFASCQNKNNRPAEADSAEPQEQSQAAAEPQLTEEQQAVATDWHNWENLEEARKAEIVNYCKTCYDNGKTPAITCKHRQARVDSLMGIWDKLSLDDRKAAMELACKICKDHGDGQKEACNHEHEHEGEHCQE